jgi:RHS repeat-associated protein
MAVYEYRQGSWSHTEQHLYGADRLGVHTKPVALAASGHNYMFLATKKYELSNHLGNVMAVVTDRRFVNSTGTFATAEVVSATDYFVFGMEMHGRTFSSSAYDYGFNGKIEDSEILSNGRWQDYGFRAYRNDLGRFVSVDPLRGKYPMSSPYVFAVNSPIYNVDSEGASAVAYITTNINAVTGRPIIKVVSNYYLYGPDATADRASQITTELSRQYNNEGVNFTHTIVDASGNSVTYDVVFDFSAVIVTEEQAKEHIVCDKDYHNLPASDNYFYVSEDVPARRGSYVDNTSVTIGEGNAGAFKTSQLDKMNGTASHEANHGMGGENKDFKAATRNDTDPDIAIVPAYTTVPELRRVKQENIDSIFSGVKFENGKANLGTPRPYLYSKTSSDSTEQIESPK